MATPDARRAAPVAASFSVQRGSRRVRLTYQQLFAAGYKRWLISRYEEAVGIFEPLRTVSDRGPRAHILLAHCRAMLGDYSRCSSTLAEGLSAESYGNAAADLHDIFVLWKCALYQDVKQGLERFVAEYPELPTPCLILGEFLMQAGNRHKPPLLLKQAIERDRPDGAIAAIARMRLADAVRSAPARPSRLSDGSKHVGKGL